MLIHKRTMGVLDTCWTGETHLDPKSGLQMPVEREYTFRTAPELSPEEWWEVSRGSKLGKKLRMYYPWITPVVDEAGMLADVELQRETPAGELEAGRAVLKGEAARRGYRTAGRVRPKNMMPFLGVHPCTSNPGAAPDMRGNQPRKEE